MVKHRWRWFRFTLCPVYQDRGLSKRSPMCFFKSEGMGNQTVGPILSCLFTRRHRSPRSLGSARGGAFAPGDAWHPSDLWKAKQTSLQGSRLVQDKNTKSQSGKTSVPLRRDTPAHSDKPPRTAVFRISIYEIGLPVKKDPDLKHGAIHGNLWLFAWHKLCCCQYSI